MKKILLLSLCVLHLVNAHPHTFITTILEPAIENERFEGVWVNWEFDEIFSASVIEMADSNGDGKISATELPIVEKDAFSNLINYGYFIFFREGENRWSPKTVEKFSAQNKHGKMHYRFFIAHPQEHKEVFISIIDPSFYCATIFNKATPIRFTKTAPATATYTLTANKKFPVYYDPKGSIDDNRIQTKLKPGFLTAYPEEAAISW